MPLFKHVPYKINALRLKKIKKIYKKNLKNKENRTLWSSWQAPAGEPNARPSHQSIKCTVLPRPGRDHREPGVQACKAPQNELSSVSQVINSN